jgi:hypothetical protein
MGFYKTENCFFTGKSVVSSDETDGTFLDGYYYRIEYNSKIREFKLSKNDDWQNDQWLKQNGHEFLELIDKNDEWFFFKEGRYLSDIKQKYYELKD